MDPRANLREQLMLARHIQNSGVTHDGLDFDLDRLAELILALDEWMRKGGFSPWS